MNISSTTLARPPVKLTAAPQKSEAAQVTAGPQESFTLSEEKKTPTLVKAGKFALAAAVTAGAGAMAYYGGSNVGTAATVAGVAGGMLAGATVGGVVGLMADIGGGIMGNSNHSTTLTLVGGAIGAAGGGYIGAMVQNGAAGALLGIGAGVAGLALTSAATNILSK